MKVLLSLFLSILSVNCVQAQQRFEYLPFENYPERQFKLDFVYTDVLLSRGRFEVAYRWDGPHTVGLGMGWLSGNYDFNNSIMTENDRYVSGFYSNLSYKVYLHRNVNDHFSFFRITPFYQSANVHYNETGWISYEQNGLTYYRRGLIAKKYPVKTFGTNLELGFEVYRDFFAFEFSFGAQYREKLNTDVAPVQFDSGDQMTDLDFTGFSPYISSRISFYFF